MEGGGIILGSYCCRVNIDYDGYFRKLSFVSQETKGKTTCIVRDALERHCVGDMKETSL